ncbi:MAG: N-acetylglucosamine-specific PTS transporter subunit IIBC [Tissierellia bacterium]|nr:N-acetylglucosamine-specific PTS transporter subunit IIBC [Tissierellia bacterium]
MLKRLQKLGGALMQPVAVLPLAAVLMGVGYWIDPTGWGANNVFSAVLIKAGGAILDNLGLIFAVGVSYGLSKDKNGAASLAGLVAFLTLVTVLSSDAIATYRGVEELPVSQGWDAVNNKNVLFGIIAGLLGSYSYNKFYQSKLPDALAFFSGRRSSPIMAGVFALITSLVLYFIWPLLYGVLYNFGISIAKMGPIGAALYGFFNRLLIPTGLHHALNSIFWFDIIGIADISRFWGPAAEAYQNLPAEITNTGYYVGMYQAGFFPIMMFGLPGAAMAMYHTAKDNRKKVAFSLLMAAAFAAFFTGVTEPIEFAFMFLAPGLYLLHAVLTAVSLFVVAKFHLAAGFSFSAGFIDWFLSLKNPNAERPLLLLAFGLAFFALYYVIFRFVITKFNLKTPGREDEIVDDLGPTSGKGISTSTGQLSPYEEKADTIVQGLGGIENIKQIENCATRLRVEVADDNKINENLIKKAGVAGIMKTGANAIQIIIGTDVQFVYDEIMKMK